MISTEEMVSEMEKVIAAAKDHAIVYLLTPHSFYEGTIRKLISVPIPGNITFIPQGEWLQELKKLQRQKIFIVSGCQSQMDSKTLDALAKAMMG